MTDSSSVVKVPGKHDKVNHSEKEYVRHENGLCITTNSAEGFFATLKRGIKGRVPPRWPAAFTPLPHRVRFQVQCA